jgi:hypothetical protein
VAPSRRTNQARALVAARRRALMARSSNTAHLDGKSTSAPSSGDERPTAIRADVATRFQPGNQAARRHGLRALARKELRRRDRRTEKLLRDYLNFRADIGRPISPTALPLARRYVECEVLARDFYAAHQAQPNNTKYHQQWVSTTRAQALLAVQLGESVSRANGGQVDSLQNSALWRIAEASRARRQLEAAGDN